MTAAALGTFGYHRANPDLALADDFYKALQLFFLNGDGAVANANLSQQTARFLAPAVLVYAAIRTGALLLADGARSGACGF